MRKLAAVIVAGALALTPSLAVASGAHHSPCGKNKPHHANCGKHKRVRKHKK